MAYYTAQAVVMLSLSGSLAAVGCLCSCAGQADMQGAIGIELSRQAATAGRRAHARRAGPGRADDTRGAGWLWPWPSLAVFLCLVRRASAPLQSCRAAEQRRASKSPCRHDKHDLPHPSPLARPSQKDLCSICEASAASASCQAEAEAPSTVSGQLGQEEQARCALRTVLQLRQAQQSATPCRHIASRPGPPANLAQRLAQPTRRVAPL